MTHSHALDLEIVERVLKRNDVAFLGLIGQNQGRKVPSQAESEGDRFVAPGMPGRLFKAGKHPAEVAVSAVAQLPRGARRCQSVARWKAWPARSAVFIERRGDELHADRHARPGEAGVGNHNRKPEIADRPRQAHEALRASAPWPRRSRCRSRRSSASGTTPPVRVRGPPWKTRPRRTR